MRRGEIIIGAVLVLLCAGVWIESVKFSSGTGMVKTLSPAVYPRLVGTLLGIAGLFLMTAALRRPREKSQQVGRGNWPKVFLGLGLMLFQAFTFDALGYFPSTFLIIAAMIVALQVKLWKSLLITGGFLVFVYLFFVQLIGLRLPMDFLPFLFSGS